MPKAMGLTAVSAGLSNDIHRISTAAVTARKWEAWMTCLIAAQTEKFFVYAAKETRFVSCVYLTSSGDGGMLGWLDTRETPTKRCRRVTHWIFTLVFGLSCVAGIVDKRVHWSLGRE